ncbi:hypothetical protein GR160_14380 [Flavobacterium sp. Sd200]|uniref:M1 family aminopeptidase n=1 Tax=Flavobacterium sp. Sd200 TaxID=2692211 RepID=UPI0013689113|nr:M1 family aminopeptidase [Flavobacterium sp. Sd200]MXN92412.1 hypothetical protein [Flavobacterium sp. Sd200]
MLWIFLFIITLITFLNIAFDNGNFGGAMGSIKKNAPYILQEFYAQFSIIALLMTTAFMNATASRDFQHGMYQFVFSSPIKKRDYYFGKFIGAAIISLIPLLGVSLGFLIAPILAPIWPDSFEMAAPDRFGNVIWMAHLQSLIVFGIPNIIITGVLMYGLAIIFRNNIVSFIGAMVIIVFYAVSNSFIRDVQKEWIANLLDPFGLNPFEIITKYMTVAEKNTQAIGLHGYLLTNRIIWVAVGIALLIGIYFVFSFNTKKEKVSKKKKSDEAVSSKIVITDKVYEPTRANRFAIGTFLNLVIFEAKAIIKNPTFIIIISIGMIILITNLTSSTGGYGVAQYPVTYEVIGTIQGSLSIFMIAFITFYTGVLVWKERDAKLNEIQDATPVKTGVIVASKIAAMIIASAAVLCIAILIGIIAQTAYGYHRYELLLYIKFLLLLRLSGFAFLIVLSLFLHYLFNNRYIGYFAFVAFVIVDPILWSTLEISSSMVSFGSRPKIIYSDMNGFGPYIPSTLWFTAYWILFCTILCFIITALYVRGKEPQFKYRLISAKRRLRNNALALIVSVIAFITCAGFVYYNTQVLNKYDSADDVEKMQVDYEKKYKKYENIAQPRYTAFNYNIDIYPEDRSLTAKIEAWVKNKTDQPMSEIHFTLPQLTDSLKINVPGAKLKTNDKRLHYRIYRLSSPLAPNDSIKINIDQWSITKGFENAVSFTQLTQNGTFFNNMDLLPIIGYNSNFEIGDKNRRKRLKLPKRDRMPKLDENNLVARGNTYLGSDSDWVTVNTTISTSADQTAIAPGSLVKKWTKDDRNYFNYKLDQKALNFYSFISARYEVARQKWNGIDLEVYYDKNHAYNVPNMLKSMEKSLEYYTANFGPYYQKQCRIIEFPRYRTFAQAFPGTMPFSEGIGFIIDLRDVTKDDIDQVYYVVAHEMAHQYWAHQVCGANMQGSEMMSEGFAQYSALMVMEKEYGKDKMKKFLKYEMDDYLNGRSSESEAEQPLMKTESQQYIHYNKASVVMYYLKEMIGEKNVNLALKNLIDKYAYKEPPYPTSIAAVNEFKKVTPPDMQYLIEDMFENITLFSNRMLSAKYKKVGNEYEVTLKTTSEKFRADSLGTETPKPIADLIDIGVFAKPADDENMGKPLVYKRVKITKKDNTFTFRTKELPYEAGIDPYNYLIDRLPDDNVKKTEE